MTKPSSSSVLLLELEDLKEHMNRVQAEVARCVNSLAVQSEEICEVLARLEIVTAIVRAVDTVDRNKKEEKIIDDDPGPVQESFVNFYPDNLGVGSKESYCAFREGEQHFPLLGNLAEKKTDQKSDVNYRNKEASELNMNSSSFTPASLINVMTSETNDHGIVAIGGEAGGGHVLEIVEATEEDKIMNTEGDILESLDNVLRSTRPSLSKNRRKIVKAAENDSIVTTTSNTAIVATKSVSSFLVPSNPKMSLPSSCSSSMVNSTSSMVNRVKKMCSKQGWKVEGSYSTREGKEGCGMVHFYKLEVKGGMGDLLTRGVGESKVEAVRRAFKTMENRLIGLGIDSELGRNVEKLKKQEELCDNYVNFPDEVTDLAEVPESESEDSLSPPPLFHAKDCVAPDFLRVKESKDPNRVYRTLTVSNDDAGAIIGAHGTNITRIRQEADVSIQVEDLVEGRQGRLVKMWGTKASVGKAQKMIKATIEK